MKIGSIGSVGLSDLYRLYQSNKTGSGEDKAAAGVDPAPDKTVISDDNRDMSYLERQAMNAQRMEMELRGNSFDISL